MRVIHIRKNLHLIDLAKWIPELEVPKGTTGKDLINAAKVEAKQSDGRWDDIEKNCAKACAGVAAILDKFGMACGGGNEEEMESPKKPGQMDA